MHSVREFGVCRAAVKSEELLVEEMIWALLTVITTWKPGMTLLLSGRPPRFTLRHRVHQAHLDERVKI